MAETTPAAPPATIGTPIAKTHMKRLEPAKAAQTPVRQPLPIFRIMARQIPGFADMLTKRDGMGNPLPMEARTGGQFSLLRLMVVDPRQRGARRFREVWVGNATPTNEWGIQPYERLSNPGVKEGDEIVSILPEVVAAWRKQHTTSKGDCPEFPQCFVEDCEASDFAELNYGVLEVVFENLWEMELIANAHDCGELATFDPLPMNDYVGKAAPFAGSARTSVATVQRKKTRARG